MPKEHYILAPLAEKLFIKDQAVASKKGFAGRRA
jgi:hypothetical protein